MISILIDPCRSDFAPQNITYYLNIKSCVASIFQSSTGCMDCGSAWIIYFALS